MFTYAPHRWWKRTDELYETVRIGAGLGATGRLADDAIERGLETLAVFERFCAANELGPDDVHAVATSAIRDATNGRVPARRRAATGLKIEVLPSEEEARFGYVAAVNTSTMTDGVVLEIGGGSMQLIEVGRPAREGADVVPARRRPADRGVPAGGRAGEEEGPPARPRPRPRGARRPPLARPTAAAALVGIGGAVRNLAAAAQHEPTSSTSASRGS